MKQSRVSMPALSSHVPPVRPGVRFVVNGHDCITWRPVAGAYQCNDGFVMRHHQLTECYVPDTADDPGDQR